MRNWNWLSWVEVCTKWYDKKIKVGICENRLRMEIGKRVMWWKRRWTRMLQKGGNWNEIISQRAVSTLRCQQLLPWIWTWHQLHMTGIGIGKGMVGEVTEKQQLLFHARSTWKNQAKAKAKAKAVLILCMEKMYPQRRLHLARILHFIYLFIYFYLQKLHYCIAFDTKKLQPNTSLSLVCARERMPSLKDIYI